MCIYCSFTGGVRNGKVRIYGCMVYIFKTNYPRSRKNHLTTTHVLV